MSRPDLTVLVPIRNESRFIESTLDQFRAQSLAPDRWEAIVVDGMSDDDTWERVGRWIEAHPDVNVRRLRNPVRLSAGARNIALREGQGRYFLLIDGHVHIPSDTLFADALALADQHGAECLGRPQPLDPPGISEFQVSVNIARHSPLAHSGESYIYSDKSGFVSPLSVATMYSRRIVDEVGYFDERFDAAEDLEYNYRVEAAGHACFIAPELAVKYFPRDSIGALFRQLRRYGNGRVRFVTKHPQRFRLELLLPPALLAYLVTSVPFAILLGAVLAGWAGLAWLLPAAAYGVILLSEGARLSRPGHPALRLATIIGVVHAGLGYGMVEQLVRQCFRRGRT